MKYKTGEEVEKMYRIQGRYRPLSDTAILWAERYNNVEDTWVDIPLYDRMRLDADTSVEIALVGAKALVGCQVMHASYDLPDGLPVRIVEVIESLLQSWVANDDEESPISTTVSVTAYVDVEELMMPKVPEPARASRAVQKAVEASIADMTEKLQKREGNDRYDAGFAAMQELVASVTDSDGLSCYRTAIAALNALGASEADDESQALMWKVAKKMAFVTTWEEAARLAVNGV